MGTLQHHPLHLLSSLLTPGATDPQKLQNSTTFQASQAQGFSAAIIKATQKHDSICQRTGALVSCHSPVMGTLCSTTFCIVSFHSYSLSSWKGLSQPTILPPLELLTALVSRASWHLPDTLPFLKASFSQVGRLQAEQMSLI